MSLSSYMYTFDDIIERGSLVHATVHHKGGMTERHKVSVGASDTNFLFRRVAELPSTAADFIDLGIAVVVADRLTIRHNHEPCRIHIELSMRHPEVFQRANVVDSLQKLLNWYTRDLWSFSFRERRGKRRLSEIQSVLPFLADPDKTVEVALWSGGLDAFAGLHTRFTQQTADQYVLFGTGMNSQVHRLQSRTATKLPDELARVAELIRLPISWAAPKLPERNKAQRARGFVFLILGAACAIAHDQDQLVVYENGVGAINLPYRDSEIGLDHARSVHPLSLVRMSNFVTEVLGKKFKFVNPFLFHTKAQMCESLTDPNVQRLAFTTITCDSLDRTVRHRPIRQCGKCSSCLLRRQAFAVVGIHDQTPYVHHAISRSERYLHFGAMLDQVETLRSLIQVASPWRSITRKYGKLQSIADHVAVEQNMELGTVEQQLLQMYTRYVGEWDSVRTEIGHQLTKKRPLTVV